MLTTCWHHAGNMLATCWQHAGNMLAKNWQHAGNMLEICWQHVWRITSITGSATSPSYTAVFVLANFCQTKSIFWQKLPKMYKFYSNCACTMVKDLPKYSFLKSISINFVFFPTQIVILYQILDNFTKSVLQLKSAKHLPNTSIFWTIFRISNKN